MSELRAGRELNVAVHAALGNEILTHDQMLSIATEIWKKQPLCCVFREGFSFVDSDEAGNPRFEQGIGRYSTESRACSLAKGWLRKRCLGMEITWRSVIKSDYAFEACASEVGENEDSFTEFGSTEEEAIARLVLAVAGEQGQ